MHLIKPYRIDSFAIGNRASYSGVYAARQWKGSSDFLSNCDDYCSDEINHLFYERVPWSAIRNGNIAFEESWSIQDNKKSNKKLDTVVKHGRFWVSSSRSRECLAPLYVDWTNRDPSKCIAGKEVPSISANYIFQIYPFYKDIPKSNYRRGNNLYTTSKNGRFSQSQSLSISCLKKMNWSQNMCGTNGTFSPFLDLKVPIQ